MKPRQICLGTPGPYAVRYAICDPSMKPRQICLGTAHCAHVRRRAMSPSMKPRQICLGTAEVRSESPCASTPFNEAQANLPGNPFTAEQ